MTDLAAMSATIDNHFLLMELLMSDVMLVKNFEKIEAKMLK